jgi:CYTH domain-containing protein
MGIEIERKFLVTGTTWLRGARGLLCRQGYLAAEIGCTVRVRIMGKKAFLTIKGRKVKKARPEYEYQIPVKDARELLAQNCTGSLVEKYRYLRKYAGHTWEIDVFTGDNKGLIVAEIELETPAQHFDLPRWVGREVTDDRRYLNVNLSRNPFRMWKKLR